MRNVAFIFVLLTSIAYGQKKDTVQRYLDENLGITSAEKAVYYGVSVKQNDHWLLYAVYPDTTPVLSAYFKDKGLKIKDGPFTTFYPRNKKDRHGYFKNNVQSGIWQSWYANGQLRDSGMTREGRKIGIWKAWYETGGLMLTCHFKETSDQTVQPDIPQDPLAGTGLKDGPYQSWYENGSLESEGQFKDNLFDGQWNWYHDNGNPSTIEKYSNGKLSDLTCFDTTGKQTDNLCSISKPPTLKGYGDYKEFIRENLQWPDEAVKRKIEGDVKVNFTITKEGAIEKLTLSGKQPILQQAVRFVFDRMKQWYPAISHNRNVASEEEVIIPFYLNR